MSFTLLAGPRGMATGLLSNGVAVGWYNDGSGYGILTRNTNAVSFLGTATAPVWWVRCNTVQESGGSTAWPGHGAAGGLVSAAGDHFHSPQVNLSFAHCSILARGDGGGLSHFADDEGSGYLTLNGRDSEFYGGMIGDYCMSWYFTNCLMDRVNTYEWYYSQGTAFILANCTWHGGVLAFMPQSTGTNIAIRVRDCAFDGTRLFVSGCAADTNYANYDYNAFTNTAGKFPIGGTHDQIVSDGFNWQSSWFGNYYLPSDSPLIGRGNVTANLVGLYHFTTQVGGAPQGDSQVDIGYHYVATDAYGNPLNTVGGPLPDYLADARGDGLFDAGDPYNWLINPYNGLTFPSGLQVFTPLK